jgi:hypothetical protein
VGTSAGMITQGRKLLGTREKPMGSNKAPPVTTWYGMVGAWCDMSVSYEAAHSDNAAAIGGKFAYVPAHMQWAKSKGLLHYGIGGIKAGAVVGFNWSRRKTTLCDHVGIVERVLSDGTIYTLEGNTGDVFARKHRDGTYVSCWFMPRYAVTPAPAPPTTADSWFLA